MKMLRETGGNLIKNSEKAFKSRADSRDIGFGARIKRLRLAKGMTLQTLSDNSGLAVSTISKVEQSQMSPTYENILRLADGLGVDVVEIVSKAPMPMMSGRRSVTRAGTGEIIRSPNYDYSMLCTDLSNKHFMPIFATLRAKSSQALPDFIRHDGEEFIYVLSGQVRLVSEFYEPLDLAVGDCCYFDSTMGHICLSVGEIDAQILWVCSRQMLNSPFMKALRSPKS